jgi:hypothetical protein
VGYYEQSLLSTDPDFAARVAACAAVEIELGQQQAVNWAAEHVWVIAASPGFADAYSSALAGAVPNPGRDPAVISDDQIRAAVVAEAGP